MRRPLTVTAVLGGGAALTFAAALLASQLFPNGTLVPGAWAGGGGTWRDGVAVPIPAPLVLPSPGLVPLPLAPDDGTAPATEG